MSRITTSIAGVIALAFVPVGAQAQEAILYETRTYGDYDSATVNQPHVIDAGFATVEQEAEAIRLYQGQFTPVQTVAQHEYPLAKTYSSRQEALADIEIELFDTPIPAVNAYAHSNTFSTSAPHSYNANVSMPTYQAYAPVTTQSYVVKAGDTVYAIGRSFGLKASEVMNANGLTSGNIKPGQTLTIPSKTATLVQALPVQTNTVTTASTQVIRNVTPIPGNVHAVLPGDTLYSLSKRYCTSAYAIASASGISSTGVLSLGQELTLPAGHCVP